jgi:hypothetical protein
MTSIPYDASRDALYSPASRPTVFAASAHYDDLALAVECARLAYVRFENGDTPILADALQQVRLDQLVTFDDATTGTQGFGASRADDDLIVLAFRGTEPTALSDLGADLAVTLTDWTERDGRVHHGFARAARSVFAAVDRWLLAAREPNTRLIVTGHSLGAAIATLYASVLAPQRLVTIGSPRVGDERFVATLDGIDMTRFVDCCDIVTQLPPEIGGYVHAGEAIYLDRDGQHVPAADPHFIDADRSAARVAFLRDYAWKSGNVLLRDLADHAPINYVRCLIRSAS